MDYVLQLCHDRKLPYEVHSDKLCLPLPWGYEEVPSRTYSSRPPEKVRRWKYFRYLRQLWTLERAEVNWNQPWTQILGVHYDPVVETMPLPPPIEPKVVTAALEYVQNLLPTHTLVLAGSVVDGTSLQGCSDIDIQVSTEDVVATYQELAKTLLARCQQHSLRIESPYGPIDLVPFNPKRQTLCYYRPQLSQPRQLPRSHHFEFLPGDTLQVSGGHQLTAAWRYEKVPFIPVPAIYRTLTPRFVLQLVVYSALHETALDPHFLAPYLEAEVTRLAVQQRTPDSEEFALSHAQKLFPERTVTLAPTLGNYGQSVIVDICLHSRPNEDICVLREELQRCDESARLFPLCFMFPRRNSYLRYFVFDPVRHEVARMQLEL